MNADKTLGVFGLAFGAGCVYWGVRYFLLSDPQAALVLPLLAIGLTICIAGIGIMDSLDVLTGKRPLVEMPVDPPRQERPRGPKMGEPWVPPEQR